LTYRKVSQAYWEGDLAEALRGDTTAHAVAFYLMTCPASNAIGLYRIATPTICDDLGIDGEAARSALFRLSGERVSNAFGTRRERVDDALRTPFILVDDVYRMLWVVELARHEWGETPNPESNQVKGLVKMMDAFTSVGRKSALWADFRARYSPGWDPVFDRMANAFGTRLERVVDASGTRSRLSLARASGSGILDPDQDPEGEERAGAPGPARCARDHKGDEPCPGCDFPGLPLEDPDDAANPYGAPGEEPSPAPDPLSPLQHGEKGDTAASDPGRASPKSTPAERRAEFDVWWTDYPKRTGKKEALAAWCRIPDDDRPSPEEVVEFIRSAEKTRRWSSGYAKGGAPFVNQRAWEDDLAAYDAGGGNGGRPPPAFPTLGAEPPEAEAERHERVWAEGKCRLCGEKLGGAKVQDFLCVECDKDLFGPESSDPAPEWAGEERPEPILR